MRGSRGLHRSPAIGLVGAGAVSVQFGAALATKLFARVGPAGAVTLRLAIAALALLGATAVARGGRSGRRPARPARSDLVVAVAFGLVLAAMNLSFYESIARIPLGVAVTVEFAGPLTVAIAGSRRWSDGLFALCAGAGVALLATGTGRHLDLLGMGYALLGGAFWAVYILLSRETGRRFESFRGLVWAMSVGALVLLPLGVLDGGASLLSPSVLAIGAVVAVMSSVIPYSLELMALRRVTARAFGVMMSLEPAVATAAGFVVLGQHLTLREWLALALVAGANLGNSLTWRTRRAEPAGVGS